MRSRLEQRHTYLAYSRRTRRRRREICGKHILLFLYQRQHRCKYSWTNGPKNRRKSGVVEGRAQSEETKRMFKRFNVTCWACNLYAILKLFSFAVRSLALRRDEGTKIKCTEAIELNESLIAVVAKRQNGIKMDMNVQGTTSQLLSMIYSLLICLLPAQLASATTYTIPRPRRHHSASLNTMGMARGKTVDAFGGMYFPFREYPALNFHSNCNHLFNGE